MKPRRQSAAHATPMDRNIEYVPPSEEAIRQYVRTVCETLAQHDSAFNSFEVRSGLTDYLKLVASIWAKKMNACAETEEKQPGSAATA